MGLFCLFSFFFFCLVGCFVGFYFGFVSVILNTGKKSARILCLICFIVSDFCEVPGQKSLFLLIWSDNSTATEFPGCPRDFSFSLISFPLCGLRECILINLMICLNLNFKSLSPLGSIFIVISITVSAKWVNKNIYWISCLELLLLGRAGLRNWN